MSQEISIVLDLKTAEALQKLGHFVDSASEGLKRLAERAVEAYLSFEGLRKLDEVVSEAIKLEEAIGRLSERTGLSVPVINQLRESANRVGQDFGALSNELTIFGAKVYEAATNGGQTAEMFRQMGVNLIGPNGNLRAMDELLEGVAKAFGKLDYAQQNAFSRGLFGRGGSEMISMLKDLASSAGSGGGPITEQSVSLAMEFSEHLREMHESVEMVGVSFTNSILPALIDAERYAMAFPKVVANAWNEGKLPELIGLLIEAGFEIGEKAVRASFIAMWQGLTGAAAGQLDMALIDAILTFGVKAAEFLLKLFEDLVIAMAGGFDWLYDQLRVGFEEVSNFMKRMLAGVLNFFIDGWNKIAPKIHASTVGNVSWGKDEVEPGKSLDKSMEDMLAFAGPGFKAINDYLDQQLTQTREILGINHQLNASDNQRLTALERLKALLEEQAPKSEHREHSGHGDGSQGSQSLADINERVRIIDQIYKQQAKLIEQNKLLTDTQKYQELLPLMQKQVDIVLQEYDAQSKIYNDPSTPEHDKIAALKQLVPLQAQYKDLMEKSAEIQGKNSFGTQFQMAVVDIANRWGSLSQQMAHGFESVFNGAIQSISHGISKLIEGTETWGQALRNIGTAILDSIIEAIVQIGVQWAMTSLLMALLGVATTSSVAASASAAWAAPAILASIATEGQAAAEGPLAVTSALAFAPAIGAMGAAAREMGGPVEAGMPYIVGEKRPELFVPSVSGVILPSVPAPMVAQNGFGFGSGGNQPVNVILGIHGGEAAAKKWVQSKDGHGVILDLNKRHIRTMTRA